MLLNKCVFFLYFLLSIFFCCERVSSEEFEHFRVATINIWNGGLHSANGLLSFARHIDKLDPDIVALQEVYGNGAEKIAHFLNIWQFLSPPRYKKNAQPWSAAYRTCKLYTDTALLTRHKIVEFADQNCDLWGNGASIEVRGQLVNFFSLHLDYVNYGPEMLEWNPRMTQEEILQSEQVRLKNIAQLFADPQFKEWNRCSTSDMKRCNSPVGLPLLLAGDFNTPSHEDWTAETSDIHNGHIVEWPTTKILTEVGFTDAFRAIHRKPREEPGITWPYSKSPNKKDQEDRIDFVFLKGEQMWPINAFNYPNKKLAFYREEWPSDHYALIVDFAWRRWNNETKNFNEETEEEVPPKQLEMDETNY